VIDKADVTVLVGAERLYRTIQGILRMTVGQVESAELPHATALPLLEAAAGAGVRASDTDALLRKMADVATTVRTLFERHVGKLEIKQPG